MTIHFETLGVKGSISAQGMSDGDVLIGMRGKPRPSDLVAQQPLGEAVELGRGRIARTPQASFAV